MTGWVDGMGGLLEGRKSSLLENKEAKKPHPLECTQTPPRTDEVFCALFFKKAPLA
jgi:hypothetical protein